MAEFQIETIDKGDIMINPVMTVEEYLAALAEGRKDAFVSIRKTILKHLPKGFKESIQNGMIGYGVPHSLYPQGYHANPKQPLPILSIASQKNYIALHHLGLYANQNLLNWFVSEYGKQVKSKLDMGKGCIRLKHMDQIPYALIGELVGKFTPQEWIKAYQAAFRK